MKYPRLLLFPCKTFIPFAPGAIKLFCHNFRFSIESHKAGLLQALSNMLFKSTVVEQPTHIPKLVGSNPARRQKIAKAEVQLV
jgi:hypothetical protein